MADWRPGRMAWERLITQTTHWIIFKPTNINPALPIQLPTVQYSEVITSRFDFYYVGVATTHKVWAVWWNIPIVLYRNTYPNLTLTSTLVPILKILSHIDIKMSININSHNYDGLRFNLLFRDRSLITGEGERAGGNEKLDVKILFAPLYDSTIIFDPPPLMQ